MKNTIKNSSLARSSKNAINNNIFNNVLTGDTSITFGNAERDEWFRNHKPLLNKAISPWVKKFLPYGYDEEDLFQEAAIAVCSAWETYDQNRVGVLSTTYFYNCINNWMVSLYRRVSAKKRGGQSEFDYQKRVFSLNELSDVIEFSDDNETEVPDAHNGYMYPVNDPYEVVDMRASLESALESIDDQEYDDVLALRMHGYEVKEIAELTGLSKSTVHRIIRVVSASCKRF